jgi:purine-cytosine permease-like protein
MANDPAAGSPAPSGVRRDRLTIARLLLLTAGVAVGLGVYAPDVSLPEGSSVDRRERWLGVANAVLIGLALPAPLFAIGLQRRERVALGVGGLFALMASLGALTLMPAMLMMRLSRASSGAALCLHYALPLMGLWCVLAAVVGGQARFLFRKDAPWLDRYGAFLALLWSPLGVRHLIWIYRDLF